MNHKYTFKVLFLFSMVFLVNLKIAEACSCGAAPNVLDAFEAAGNVVILKAVSVEKVGKDEEFAKPDGVKSTRMMVEKVYKGKLKASDEIIFAQGGGADCIWTFSEQSVGEKYLFYLPEGDKTKSPWLGFGCGRSNLIEGAADDLLFLEKLAKVRGKTRISGTINFADYIALPAPPPVEGIKIKIIGGGGTFNLKTDKNGVYEIYDLPPGRYEIVPEVPKGWRVNEFFMRYTDIIGKGVNDDKPIKEYAVKLEARRHATVDFHFEIYNAIRGKILAPDGKPMRRVCVNLYPPTGITKNVPYLADCVEKDEDTFEIDEIPPGRYILVANDEGEITSSEPFKTVYYPGTFELEKASVIDIGIGEFLENIDIYVPKIEELITVQGVFLYSDGKPVVDESVQFKSTANRTKYSADALATTDAQGRFIIKILKGMKGSLFGSMYAYIGEFENCPKLETLIRQTGKTSFESKTQEIEISGEDNVFDVELKFPFPGCKKAKD